MTEKNKKKTESANPETAPVKGEGKGRGLRRIAVSGGILLVVLAIVMLAAYHDGTGFDFLRRWLTYGTAEQADSVRNAAQVCWAGGDFAAVKAGEDEPVKLVRLSDGQVVLGQVDHICSTGGYACAETPEGTWLISADGTAAPLGKDFAGGSESYPVMGRYGLFFGSSEGQMCVFEKTMPTLIQTNVTQNRCKSTHFPKIDASVRVQKAS